MSTTKINSDYRNVCGFLESQRLNSRCETHIECNSSLGFGLKHKIFEKNCKNLPRFKKIEIKCSTFKNRFFVFFLPETFTKSNETLYVPGRKQIVWNFAPSLVMEDAEKFEVSKYTVQAHALVAKKHNRSNNTLNEMCTELLNATQIALTCGEPVYKLCLKLYARFNYCQGTRFMTAPPNVRAFSPQTK